MYLHSDNLGFPEMWHCPLCHNVDTSGTNRLCWRVAHSSTQTQFMIAQTTQKVWGTGGRLTLPSRPLHKEFHLDQRHSRCVISVSFGHCRNTNCTSWSTSCRLFKNTVLSALKSRTLESTDGLARPTLTTLSMILHKNDDAFRHFYRRQNQGTRKSTHVAANHSTNSLWLKLTRLGTITIDEP